MATEDGAAKTKAPRVASHGRKKSKDLIGSRGEGGKRSSQSRRKKRTVKGAIRVSALMQGKKFLNWISADRPFGLE